MAPLLHPSLGGAEGLAQRTLTEVALQGSVGISLLELWQLIAARYFDASRLEQFAKEQAAATEASAALGYLPLDVRQRLWKVLSDCSSVRIIVLPEPVGDHEAAPTKDTPLATTGSKRKAQTSKTSIRAKRQQLAAGVSFQDPETQDSTVTSLSLAEAESLELARWKHEGSSHRVATVTVFTATASVSTAHRADSWQGVRLEASEAFREAVLGVHVETRWPSALPAMSRQLLELIARAREDGILQAQVVAQKLLNVNANNLFYYVTTLVRRGLVTKSAVMLQNKASRRVTSSHILHLARFAPVDGRLRKVPIAALASIEQCTEELGAIEDKTEGDNGGEGPNTSGGDPYVVYDGRVMLLTLDDSEKLTNICSKLESSKNQVMVEADLKLVLGYSNGDVGHRMWRRLRQLLLQGKYIECFTAMVPVHTDGEGKVTKDAFRAMTCVRLLKHYKHTSKSASESQPDSLKEGGSDEAAAAKPVEDAPRAGECVTTLGQEHYSVVNSLDIVNRRIYDAVRDSGTTGITTNDLFSKLNVKKEYWRLLELVNGNIFSSTLENTGKSVVYRFKLAQATEVRGGAVALGRNDACEPMSEDRAHRRLYTMQRDPTRTPLDTSIQEIAQRQTAKQVKRRAGVTESFLQRLQWLLDLLRERRVLVQADAVRYLQRKEEERDNAKSTLDRNTVKKAIEHLREVGECTSVEIGIPGVTHTGVNTFTVLLAKGEKMTPDRVAEVAQYVRQVDKQQRERPFLGVRKAEDLGSIATKTGLQVAEVARVDRSAFGRAKRDQHTNVDDSADDIDLSALPLPARFERNGYAREHMLRYKSLHLFLVRQFSRRTSESVAQVRSFTNDEVAEALPLDTFLTVVGATEFVTVTEISTFGATPLRDLREDLRAKLIGSRNVYGPKRLTTAMDYLRRLGLLKLNYSVCDGGLMEVDFVLSTQASLDKLSTYKQGSAEAGVSVAGDADWRITHCTYSTGTEVEVEKYWETLKDQYTSDELRTGYMEPLRSTFPANVVPEVLDRRSWESYLGEVSAVGRARKYREIYDRLQLADPTVRTTALDCGRLAEDLNVDLNVLLSLSYYRNHRNRLHSLRSSLKTVKRDMQEKKPTTKELWQESPWVVVERQELWGEAASDKTVHASQGKLSGALGMATEDGALRMNGESLDSGPVHAARAKTTAVQEPILAKHVGSSKVNDNLDGDGNSDDEYNGEEQNDDLILAKPARVRRPRFVWCHRDERLLLRAYATWRAEFPKPRSITWSSLAELPAEPLQCQRHFAIMRAHVPEFTPRIRLLCTLLRDRRSRLLRIKREKIVTATNAPHEASLASKEPELLDDEDKQELQRIEEALQACLSPNLSEVPPRTVQSAKGTGRRERSISKRRRTSRAKARPQPQQFQGKGLKCSLQCENSMEIIKCTLLDSDLVAQPTDAGVVSITDAMGLLESSTSAEAYRILRRLGIVCPDRTKSGVVLTSAYLQLFQRTGWIPFTFRADSKQYVRQLVADVCSRDSVARWSLNLPNDATGLQVAGILAGVGMGRISLRPKLDPTSLSVSASLGGQHASADAMRESLNATQWDVFVGLLDSRDGSHWVAKASANCEETLSDDMKTALALVRARGPEGLIWGRHQQRKHRAERDESDHVPETVMHTDNATSKDTPSSVVAEIDDDGIDSSIAVVLRKLGLVQLILGTRNKKCVATEHAEQYFFKIKVSSTDASSEVTSRRVPVRAWRRPDGSFSLNILSFLVHQVMATLAKFPGIDFNELHCEALPTLASGYHAQELLAVLREQQVLCCSPGGLVTRGSTSDPDLPPSSRIRISTNRIGLRRQDFESQQSLRCGPPALLSKRPSQPRKMCSHQDFVSADATMRSDGTESWAESDEVMREYDKPWESYSFFLGPNSVLVYPPMAMPARDTKSI